MSLWLTHPLLLPSLIVGVTIVLWATSLLPEFITALLFFTAAMTARIAPPEVIFGGFASSAFWLVFSGFVLGVAIRKTGLADRAARALSAKLTDSWVLMVAGWRLTLELAPRGDLVDLCATALGAHGRAVCLWPAEMAEQIERLVVTARVDVADREGAGLSGQQKVGSHRYYLRYLRNEYSTSWNCRQEQKYRLYYFS